jgi:hypothetical protein
MSRMLARLLPAYARFAIRCSQLATRGHTIGTRAYTRDNQYERYIYYRARRQVGLHWRAVGMPITHCPN